MMININNLSTESITYYIASRYPNSCIAYNSGNVTNPFEKPYRFPTNEDCEDFFYCEKLNWCGCGHPEDAKRCIRDYLNIITERDYDKKKKLYQDVFKCDSVYDNPLLLCLAYTLDAAGFTEHGSSVGGAYLTNEGKMFMWLLNRNEELNNVQEQGKTN